MIWLSGLLMLAAVQSGDPYAVDDPFALEDPAPLAAPTTTVVEEPAVSAEPSSEALICRTRQELGTRTRYRRICMTQVQWDHHETNMEQQRRDINDMGAAGCDRNYDSNCIAQSVRPM